jgi:competence ComEA-like helix-hairpin-helix protein
MPATLAAIRRFLIDTFDDEELSDFCFDHFQEVYSDFTSGMTLGRKARQLVDYCRRRERVPELLAHLARARPEPFRRAFGGATAPAVDRLNVNLASAAELQRLPGIGPRLAEAIIAGRPYSALDDLARVKGIGPGRLATVRDRCVV